MIRNKFLGSTFAFIISVALSTPSVGAIPLHVPVNPVKTTPLYFKQTGSTRLSWNISGPAAISADAFEPDDNSTQANEITSALPQNHSIDPADDIDWVYFNLTEPSAVTLETTGAQGGDTYLTLYGSDAETVVVENDDKDGLDDLYSLINLTCEQAPLYRGKYYVMVQDPYYDPDTGDYQLAFTATPCYDFTDFVYLPFITDQSPAPGEFGKLTPLNSATGLNYFPLLTWEASPGASGYYYCIDELVDGVCTGGWSGIGNTTEINAPAYENGKTYEWQIKALNSDGVATYADAGTMWNFTIAELNTWDVITSEDFEGAFPQTGWTRYDGDGATNGEYYVARSDCFAFSGSYSGWMVGAGADGNNLSCNAIYPNNARSYFNYGPFDTTGATEGQLNFVFYLYSEEPDFDKLSVGVSSDGTNFYGDWWAGVYANQSYTLDLSRPLCAVNTESCLDQPSVWIRFSFTSDPSIGLMHGAYLDDIDLRTCPSGICSPYIPLPSPASLQPVLDPWQHNLHPFAQNHFEYGVLLE